MESYMGNWISPRELLSSIIEQMSGSADSRRVYGEPYRVGDRIVIPVADVRYSFGAGVGGGGDQVDQEGSTGFSGGGGGGGSVQTRPVGYIEMDADRADFVPVVDYNRILLAAIAVFGAMFIVARVVQMAKEKN